MKRIVSFILAVAVIFSNMTGVFAENKKSDKNDFYQSMADKYTEVIKEHSNAANLEDSPTVVQKSADDFKYINGYFYTFEKERMSPDLKYAVVDISGDGTPELIIAEMKDQKYYLSDNLRI